MKFKQFLKLYNMKMKILGMENRIEMNETPLKHFIHNYRNKTGGLTLQSDKQKM
jgi:hypothetical protein